MFCLIEARRSDVVVVDEEQKETQIIDIAISIDARICDKVEKIEK